MRRHMAWIAACTGLGLWAPGADALEIRYRDQVNRVNAFDPHGVVARRLVSPNSPTLNRLRTYQAPPVQARYKDDVKPNWTSIGSFRAPTARAPVSSPITARAAASRSAAPAAVQVQGDDVRAITSGGSVYRKLSEMANSVQK